MTARIEEATDDRLIQSTLTGDDEAFAELVRRHKRKVFGIASRFARNDHELDDICQEVFIKVYRNLRSFRATAPFEHWVSRIAVRACYDFLRAARRERQNKPFDGLEIGVYDNVGPARAAEVLRWAMARLSATERLVITLLELEEKPVREVAELTGWSESNVKVRAHRARNALKKILERSHER
ncbi:MAG TPA: sigma-70 family RNA polymerase sigma factor [Verrucomicrobiae bacterium]|nr:sigma-70 family RNA polymerase sigma factor [Verrucomicrobiae bacterium]